MNYLYETHCHGSQCSRCSLSTSRELVRAYHKAGYAGLVLTDHFIWGNTAVSRHLPWEERMRLYYAAYLDARDEAKDLDFDVIFGLEHAYGDGNEVLIYGIGLDFHEDPFVCHVSKAGTGMLMVPGMCFTIEPMVNMGTHRFSVDRRDGWTVRTADEKPSAQWEIQVVVTETGYEVISW